MGQFAPQTKLMSQPAKDSERISAEEFKRRTEENPSWAKNLTHPVVVYEYVSMINSRIKNLSRWLRFSGKNESGESANFCGSKDLENAEGTFDGSVDFSLSGVKKIGRLKVLGRYLPMMGRESNECYSAYFYRCLNLRVLRGEYAYPVAAAESNISSLENLKIRQTNAKYKIDLSCNPVKKVGENVDIDPEQIMWDEHTDDEARRIVERELSKRLKKAQEVPEATIVSASANPIATKEPTLLEESKRVVVRTIAEAIGADDILVKEEVPLSSPKRKGLFKLSTIILACVGLFIYKTSDELVKQTLIDPVVQALRGGPPPISLYIPNEYGYAVGEGRNSSHGPLSETQEGPPSLLSEKTNIKTEQGIWTNEITQDLERFARSEMSYEDKITLAKATLIALDLDPNMLCIEISHSDNSSVTVGGLVASGILGGPAQSTGPTGPTGPMVPMETATVNSPCQKYTAITHPYTMSESQKILLSAQQTIQSLERLTEPEPSSGSNLKPDPESNKTTNKLKTPKKVKNAKSPVSEPAMD